MARLEPLDDLIPELEHLRKGYEKGFGFVPNSVKTMQRRPAIVEGYNALKKAVLSDEFGNTVSVEFKGLIAHMASKAAGCMYCQSHSMYTADRRGTARERLDALWEYNTSPLFNDAEKCALDFAVAGASVPNAVTDELFAQMKQHWDEGEVIEILGVISFFGFLNRFNDSLATPLENESMLLAEDIIGEKGWEAGKHKHG